jgi:hypothetical protein
MREQLERERRILDHDWSHYTMSNVVFRPRHMTEDDLRTGQSYVYRRFYSLPSIVGRCLTVRGKLLTRLVVNLSYRGVGRGTGIARGAPAQRLPKRAPARDTA